MARDSNVDETFSSLGMIINMIKLNKGGLNLTVLTASGNPVEGVLVTGVTDANGGACYTDTNGKLSGYMSEGSVTLAISGYTDINDASKSITCVKGTIVDEVINVTTVDFLDIKSSKTLKFTANVSKLDFCLLGGGGGCAAANYDDDDNDWADYPSNGTAGGSGRATIRLYLKST